MSEHIDCDAPVDPDPYGSPQQWTCPVCGEVWELKVVAHYEPRD